MLIAIICLTCFTFGGLRVWHVALGRSLSPHPYFSFSLADYLKLFREVIPVTTVGVGRVALMDLGLLRYALCLHPRLSHVFSTINFETASWSLFHLFSFLLATFRSPVI